MGASEKREQGWTRIGLVKSAAKREDEREGEKERDYIGLDSLFRTLGT